MPPKRRLPEPEDRPPKRSARQAGKHVSPEGEVDEPRKTRRTASPRKSPMKPVVVIPDAGSSFDSESMASGALDAKNVSVKGTIGGEKNRARHPPTPITPDETLEPPPSNEESDDSEGEDDPSAPARALAWRDKVFSAGGTGLSAGGAGLPEAPPVNGTNGAAIDGNTSVKRPAPAPPGADSRHGIYPPPSGYAPSYAPTVELHRDDLRMPSFPSGNGCSAPFTPTAAAPFPFSASYDPYRMQPRRYSDQPAIELFNHNDVRYESGLQRSPRAPDSGRPQLPNVLQVATVTRRDDQTPTRPSAHPFNQQFSQYPQQQRQFEYQPSPQQYQLSPQQYHAPPQQYQPSPHQYQSNSLMAVQRLVRPSSPPPADPYHPGNGVLDNALPPIANHSQALVIVKPRGEVDKRRESNGTGPLTAESSPAKGKVLCLHDLVPECDATKITAMGLDALYKEKCASFEKERAAIEKELEGEIAKLKDTFAARFEKIDAQHTLVIQEHNQLVKSKANEVRRQLRKDENKAHVDRQDRPELEGLMAHLNVGVNWSDVEKIDDLLKDETVRRSAHMMWKYKELLEMHIPRLRLLSINAREMEELEAERDANSRAHRSISENPAVPEDEPELAKPATKSAKKKKRRW